MVAPLSLTPLHLLNIENMHIHCWTTVAFRIARVVCSALSVDGILMCDVLVSRTDTLLVWEIVQLVEIGFWPGTFFFCISNTSIFTPTRTRIHTQREADSRCGLASDRRWRIS